MTVPKNYIVRVPFTNAIRFVLLNRTFEFNLASLFYIQSTIKSMVSTKKTKSQSVIRHFDRLSFSYFPLTYGIALTAFLTMATLHLSCIQLHVQSDSRKIRHTLAS